MNPKNPLKENASCVGALTPQRRTFSVLLYTEAFKIFPVNALLQK